MHFFIFSWWEIIFLSLWFLWVGDPQSFLKRLIICSNVCVEKCVEMKSVFFSKGIKWTKINQFLAVFDTFADILCNFFSYEYL